MIILYIILCLIVLEEFIEFLYKRTHRYKNSLGGADRLKKVPDGIEICNVGSGPGLYAISYNDCKLKGFNFSTAPQSFEYGFKILKHFSKQIKPNAIIIIIIMCPLSFGANKDYVRKDYSDKFYGILQPKDIENYSLRRVWIISHPFIIHLIKKLKSILFRKKTEINVAKSNVPPVINVWEREFELDNLMDPSQTNKHQDAFKEKISILQEEFDYCYTQRWRPILVTPPIPQGTKDYIGAEFVNEFVYKNVDVLLKNNRDLIYLNYFEDTFPDSYFANDIFMNRDGQEYFSKMLFDRIKKEMGD